jgi:metal-responsive CopG/Arc/MetJ family transcriptional regulator
MFEPRMRLDAPSLECTVPVSSALPGTMVHAIDNARELTGEVSRSEFIRKAVQERLDRINAQHAIEAA